MQGIQELLYETPCPLYEMSEFQPEAFFLHLVVALRVELIEECHLLVGQRECSVKLGQDAQLQHLVVEVTAVELHAEDGLVEVLELSHGECVGQQLEAYGFEVDLAAQFVGGLTENQVVVEGQRRHLVEREPLSLGGIVASLHLTETHQGEIGDGDDSLARITVHTREGMKLMDVRM